MSLQGQRIRAISLAGLVWLAMAMPAVASGVHPAHRFWTTPAEFCEVASKRLPNVTQPLCHAAGLSLNPGRSVKGRALLQRDVVSPKARLKVLVLGGIHGEELSSTSLVLHWIATAREIPSNVHWRFVPLVNPDGMLLDKPRRTNANGVDLNRNFPTPNWEKSRRITGSIAPAKIPVVSRATSPCQSPNPAGCLTRWRPGSLI